MHFCFVSTSRGSHFMTELLGAVSAATATAGHTIELVLDKFPPLRGECVYVVVPHEFQAWGDPDGFPDSRQRARTIALCTENPGTTWFEATCELVPELAAAVSINRSSAAELRHRGIRCEHLQLGYSPLWDSWQRNRSSERHVDVLYLGAADPRRDPLLAGFGRRLWGRRCQFLVPPLEPRTRPRADFLKGDEKYNRLRSAKILLNLHRTTSSALEWMRFLEAICNGCVVVSEPCLDNEPLLPGEHFVEAGADRVDAVIDSLLDDHEGLGQLQQAAYDFVREKLPMGPVAERLAELARELPSEPPSLDGTLFSATEHRPRTLLPHSHAASLSPGLLEGPAPKSDRCASPAEANGRRFLRRKLLDSLTRRRHKSLEVVDQTPAYAWSRPRVTVLCVVPKERQDEGAHALESVASSRYRELELLILDDGSQDGAELTRRFLDRHASLAAMLLHRERGGNLASARNVLAQRARGEYVFVLDAEARIYPSALERLVGMLEANARAFFAYSMVGVFDGDEPVELRSSLPWEPERLKRGNWIDAMALIRRKRLLEFGGYATDPRLAGYEHFDLWCKFAEVGGTGVHMPEVLAWRIRGVKRREPETWTLLRERHPQLLSDQNVV